jgi:hypothetical protein
MWSRIAAALFGRGLLVGTVEAKGQGEEETLGPFVFPGNSAPEAVILTIKPRTGTRGTRRRQKRCEERRPFSPAARL